MSPVARWMRPYASAALAASGLLSKAAAMRASSPAARLRERQVAGRDRDLGLRLEERRSAKLGVRRKLLGRDRERMLERVADGIGGERDVALGEVHERETGLRVPADLVRRAKGLLRAADVSPAQADSAELHRAANRIRGVGRDAALHRRSRACCSASLHDPRSRRISARWMRQRPWMLPMGWP